MKMDRIDRHLLALIQKQGRLSTAELAELVGLSASLARGGLSDSKMKA